VYKLSYDLHIHSCLSPCASDESTPRSIALLGGMLGLEVMALTDHNSCSNLPAFFKAIGETDIIPIPGTELNTAEEIHVLCLFEELEAALSFEKEAVSPARMPILNKPHKNGNQLIADENDSIVGSEQIWLATAVNIPIYALAEKVATFGGIIVPAHINRASWGVISVLGTVPADCGYNCVEVLGGSKAAEDLKSKYDYLNQCSIIYNSDAHTLERINPPVNLLEVSEKSAKGVISALRSGSGNKANGA